MLSAVNIALLWPCHAKIKIINLSPMVWFTIPIALQTNKRPDEYILDNGVYKKVCEPSRALVTAHNNNNNNTHVESHGAQEATQAQ